MSRSIVPDAIARQPWQMLIPLFTLVTLGASVLYSAAAGNINTYAVSHVIRFCVFFVMALVMSRFTRSFYQMIAYPVYGIVLFLLVLVELIGAVGGGSQRWLNLGFMVLQPSELMKPAIVLVLARFYETLPQGMTVSWRGLVPAGILIACPMLLVMIQPDLGTSLAICFGGVVTMFLAGLPLWWFMSAGAAVAVIAPIAFFTLLHDYQRNRVLVFLDPESDPLGTGYHISQSKIAIGSGGWFGKGLGHGTQSHLKYLPEPHTDFVFATMAEEWGLIGGFFVLAVFAIMFSWSLKVARTSQDRFSSLLAAGMTATMFFYVMINLMMVMGLAPVVGIPLPFMSHGGTSMMTNMICLGMILAVNRWNQERRSYR